MIKSFRVKLFFLLQLIVVLAWFLGNWFFQLRPDYLGKNLGDVSSHLFWSRANFDGYHYVKIAREGYQYLQQAFFPLLPTLLKTFQSVFFNSYILAGIFVTSTAFYFCLKILTLLWEKQGAKEGSIKKALLFLVLFPTSFFFVSVYTEAPFLLFVLLTFYLANRKQWFLASIMAGLAAHTRLVGAFLMPALLHEYYHVAASRTMGARIKSVREDIGQHFSWKYLKYFFKTRWVHIRNCLVISTVSLWGLLSYMFYLQKTHGDFLYFIKVQPHFGAQRTVTRVIMIYQVFYRYLRMILTVPRTTPIYFTIWLEFLVAVLFLFLLALGWLKAKKYKIRTSWLVFSTLAYALPTLTGTFSSLPRYVLVCFPCFFVLAKLKLPKFVYYLSGLLLLLTSAMFLRGYWVA